MDSSLILTFDFYNPRRNLPKKIAAKRGESNFVGRFERAYTEQGTRPGIGSRHFAISGYGIADFLWISSPPSPSRCSRVRSSREEWIRAFQEEMLTAFEMKLHDWRKALQQAYRYSYFADRSVVVMPVSCRDRIEPARGTFERLNIGLWVLDPEQGQIVKIVTPEPAKAKNPRMREKALDLILRKLKLRSIRE